MVKEYKNIDSMEGVVLYTRLGFKGFDGIGKDIGFLYKGNIALCKHGNNLAYIIFLF
jgi:hypothetical protein